MITFLSDQALYVAIMDEYHDFGIVAVVRAFVFQRCRVRQVVHLLNR